MHIEKKTCTLKKKQEKKIDNVFLYTNVPAFVDNFLL